MDEEKKDSMRLMKVIPEAEAEVRALNGDLVLGCFTDGGCTWWCDLRKKRLCDAFLEFHDRHRSRDEIFFVENDYIDLEYDTVIPKGKYHIVDESSFIGIDSMRALNGELKWFEEWLNT